MRIAHVITRMIIGGAQENTLLNCLDLIDDFGDDVLLICGPSLGREGSLLEQVGLADRVGAADIGGQDITEAGECGGEGRAGRSESEATASGNSSAMRLATQVAAGRLPVRVIDPLRRNIHPWRDWRAARQLRDVLRTFSPDVVHTHSAKGGLLGRKVGWDLRVPAVIHTVHGAPFHDYQSAAARQFFIRCERWAASRCHRMISVADAMTDLMVDARVAPREKFTTILSGMNVQPFLDADQHRQSVREQYGFTDEHVVIGKVARLFHLKGHEDLVAAAASVVAAQPNVRFLLVGDGILREPLQRQIDALGMNRHFVFAGLVPPTRVPELIGGMDLLVHTSYREGLARALPQALLAGKPVISYDIDGAREVTIDDQTGYLIPAGDLAMLSQRMAQLASDADLRRRLGRAGRSRFAEPFAHATMSRKIREVYQACVAGIRRGPCRDSARPVNEPTRM